MHEQSPDTRELRNHPRLMRGLGWTAAAAGIGIAIEGIHTRELDKTIFGFASTAGALGLVSSTYTSSTRHSEMNHSVVDEDDTNPLD